MSRLDRFRFGNFRRKRLVAILLIVVSLFVFSGSILLVMGVFGFRSELVSVALTEQDENSSYNGVGLNLDYIPNVNLIRNPSFEKEAAYYSLNVLDSNGRSVFFDPTEVINCGINTKRATGAPMRIVALDADDNMMLKYEGKITGYESARLGQVSYIDLPMAYESFSGITKTCTLQNSVTALTGAGLVFADVTSEQMAKVYDGGNVSFADICCNGSVVYAVAADGVVFSSIDGKTFTQLSSEEITTDITVKSCAAGASCLVVLTLDSKLYVYDAGQYNEVLLPDNAVPEMIGSEGDTIVVICQNGSVYETANGFVYRKIDTGDIYEDRKAASVFCNAGSSYILNDDSSITVIKHDEQDAVTLLEGLSGSGSSLCSIAVTDNGQIVGATDDRTAVIISDALGTAVTISSEQLIVDGVFLSANNKVMLIGNAEVYTASVLSDFTLDSDIPADSVELGDICFIETANSYTSLSVEEGSDWSMAPEAGVWNVYGKGTSIELSPDTYDGAYALRLSGTTDNLHAVSQKLPGSIRDCFIKDKFYRISLYVKSDSSTPETLDVWLDGATFGKEGMTCHKINSEYSEYSTVFVVNDLMLGDGDITFNIAFSGSGAVLIDEVYVGPDSLSGADIPESFQQAVIDAAPKAIRFNNLGIGSNGFSERVFFGINELSTGAAYYDKEGNYMQVSDVRSLERCLRLARDASADPWFVLGSYCNPETVNNMIAYMCGSVSSDYGTRRINNGTALPWVRQFEKVYIEISDTEGCFTNDAQRSGYVDYVIGMITGSEYYTDIKDKVIFIDGMEYQGGTMLSSADSHASKMTIRSEVDVSQRNMTYQERLSLAYDEVRNTAPRVTSGNDMGEFMSSIDFEGKFNCAQYIAALMCDDTIFIEMAMINCKVNFTPSAYGDHNVFEKGDEMKMILNMLSLIKEMASSSRMYANVTDPLSSESGQSAALFLANCTVSQFDGDGNSYLVITNTSSVLQQFVMYNGAQRYNKSSVKRYSTEGELLTTQSLTNSYRRYNLQPGESIIVSLYRQGDQ